MHSLWRTLTFGVVLALGVVLGAGVVSLSAQGNDPRIGTWKLNVAKSKYSPGQCGRDSHDGPVHRGQFRRQGLSAHRVSVRGRHGFTQANRHTDDRTH